MSSHIRRIGSDDKFTEGDHFAITFHRVYEIAFHPQKVSRIANGKRKVIAGIEIVGFSRNHCLIQLLRLAVVLQSLVYISLLTQNGANSFVTERKITAIAKICRISSGQFMRDGK